MAQASNCVSRLGMGNKRKCERGNSNIQVLNAYPAESDSDSDEGYACEAPDADVAMNFVGKCVASSVSCERLSADMGPPSKQSKIKESYVQPVDVYRTGKKGYVSAFLPSSAKPPRTTASAKCSAAPLTHWAHEPEICAVGQDYGAAVAATNVKKGAELTESCIDTARLPERKLVWICGDSFARRATQGVMELNYQNLNLRNTSFDWLWVDDMRWTNLRSVVLKKVMAEGKPNVLMIHLGGNDLTELGRRPLFDIMTDTLIELAKDLPETDIVWTEIISRIFWSGAGSQAAVQRSKSKLNLAMMKFTSGMGIGFIRLGRLSHRNPDNFESDGVHLSEVGIAILRKEILEALKALGCS